MCYQYTEEYYICFLKNNYKGQMKTFSLKNQSRGEFGIVVMIIYVIFNKTVYHPFLFALTAPNYVSLNYSQLETSDII